MTITDIRTPVRDLDPDLLEDLRRLAADDDVANRFFDETHRRLVEAGHYLANVPTDMGGGGLNLFETARRQRLLGRYAPAAALASCMHLYWTGGAAELRAGGNDALDFVLDAACSGTIFASGHAEPGNDVSTLMSTTVAEPVPGGYLITGRKNFGSLGPVWDQIGFHAMDASDPDAPEVIHGFVNRTDPGVRVVENWDTIAMRASQSHDTVFDAVFVPDERIAARHPAGDGDEPVTATAFFWGLVLISNVYAGIAERALEIATETITTRTAIAMDGRTLAHNPMLQHQVADMWIALDGLIASLDMLAAEWGDEQVDHGPVWEMKLFAAKHRTSCIVRSVVDTAMEVAGGSAIRSDHELSRLLRDSRAAAYHPASDALAHEAIGKGVLGIDPGGPRW
jgi:alkylation response protein AidB-like acyl-CoA dehydrogenase